MGVAQTENFGGHMPPVPPPPFLCLCTHSMKRMPECSVPSKVYMPCNRLQYYYIPVCFKNVLMEQFDWLMVYHKRMAVWSSATGGCGAQCVMMIGTTVMQQWCADSWAIVQSVSFMLKNLKQLEFV